MYPHTETRILRYMVNIIALYHSIYANVKQSHGETKEYELITVIIFFTIKLKFRFTKQWHITVAINHVANSSVDKSNQLAFVFCYNSPRLLSL